MKIDRKRLLWALREELYILLAVVVMAALLAIIFLTGFRWWILLYPAAFFVIGVCEKYNGR